MTKKPVKIKEKTIYFKNWDNVYQEFVIALHNGFQPSITYVDNKFCLIIKPL